MLTAAILAGGSARRFNGRDKAKVIVGGSSIIERQIHTLRHVTDRLFLVSNNAARHLAFGIPIVGDLVPGSGPLGGIYTAVSVSPTDRTLVVACDMPFLTRSFLEHLVTAGAGTDDAVIARTAEGLQPLCGIYRQSCAAVFRRRIEARTLKLVDALADVRITEIPPEELIAFDPDGTLFFNVNTPEDHLRAAGHAARLRANILLAAPEQSQFDAGL
jgi:molybdenum cofactor guanylyltransferase